MGNKNKPYCLLVVEDNPGDYILVKQYLEKSQLGIKKIFRAERIAAVPELIADNVIDIVLLDLSLPDSLGINSVIAMNRLLPKTPIIVLSGHSTIDMAIESISLGAQDYLVKGDFDEKLLFKSIQYSIERKKTLEKLKESNERYELVNRATQDTIWEWNYETSKGHWGDGIIKEFGYSEDKQEYQEGWINEFVHPDDREKVAQILDYNLKNGSNSWKGEYRFRCADGSYKFVYDRGFIMRDEEGKPFRMIGAMTDVTEKKRLERELAEQQIKQQRLITETTIQSQEEEKNNLGRELHDNINQILATVKMYLGITKSGQGVQDDLVGKSYEYLNEAIDEIRKLSHSLVAPSLGGIGLRDAVEDLVERVTMGNDLKVQLINEIGNGQYVDQKIELMFYRIIQEQINNIIKYSQAKNAVISFRKDEEKIYLTISDNGVGFDTTKIIKGIGLKNIQNRINFYSGIMKVVSDPGKGCTLEIELPFNSQTEPS